MMKRMSKSKFFDQSDILFHSEAEYVSVLKEAAKPAG